MAIGFASLINPAIKMIAMAIILNRTGTLSKILFKQWHELHLPKIFLLISSKVSQKQA